jgi:hypothetical protein
LENGYHADGDDGFLSLQKSILFAEANFPRKQGAD